MALIDKLTAIADSIREKTGKADVLTLDQMPLEIAGIQTGVELNFDVVGETTEPVSPKENTIWVNTDTPITWWGIGDYQNRPGWSTPDGYVYIDADTSTNSGGDFNALKKNEIWLRPIHAKQYVSGAWVDKTAKIYQDGQWAELSSELYIFKEGNGAADGYVINAMFPNEYGFAIDNEKITWATNNTVGNQIWITPKVNLGVYKRVCVELTCTSRYNTTLAVTVGVGSDVPTGQNSPGSFDASVPAIFDTTRKVYEVPISNVSGERYIKVAAFGVTGYIHNIWLE